VINLFETYKSLILEAVNAQNVMDAIDKNYRIKIYYQGEKESQSGWRNIDIYVYGISKAGNPIIRAYQSFGKSFSSPHEPSGWKLFRLDRITQWIPTKQHYGNNPVSDEGGTIPAFNPNGDRSMATVYKIKKFNNNNNDNNLNNNNNNNDNVPSPIMEPAY